VDDRELAVQIAVLSGKIDTVIARMEAGDRNGEQLVMLVKDQLTYQAADIGETKARMLENDRVLDAAISAVRTDLTAEIREVKQDVLDHKLWKARIGGIAAASAMLGSAISAVIVKVIAT
jgi:hypothetical protein